MDISLVSILLSVYDLIIKVLRVQHSTICRNPAIFLTWLTRVWYHDRVRRLDEKQRNFLAEFYNKISLMAAGALIFGPGRPGREKPSISGSSPAAWLSY
jgi:hypothetical protein